MYKIDKIDMSVLDFAISVMLEEGNKLPVEIVKEVSEVQNIPKYLVQEIIADHQNYVRKIQRCIATNHNEGKWIVDESYGGPEHGYIGYRCKKCGFSTASQLY
ncbi:hypothetical protein M3_0065 [Lysinibacillus phage vB_LfM_LysYB1]|nr:hypothetical protein M3_0065 [Lysinibacillus phage vB_LfM_LysYB1]WAB25192.1 hypothetical protein M5_0014 [Lysinibacillus phage vB_LfM_LysYB2]